MEIVDNWSEKVKQQLASIGASLEYKQIDENITKQQLNLSKLQGNSELSVALSLGRIKSPSEGKQLVEKFLHLDLP